MSKYTDKIKNITKLGDQLQIKAAVKCDEMHTNSKCIKFVNCITTAMHDNNIFYQSEEPINLKALHSISDPPLTAVMYSYVNDIFNLSDFNAWYRKSPMQLNIDQYRRSPFYSNVKTIHDVMFNQMGTRKILHDMLYGNKFISLDVQHFAESVDLVYNQYIINGRDTIHLFIQPHEQFAELDELCNVFATMHRLVPQNSKSIELTILYCPQKKIVNWQNFSAFCTDNINSGMTIPGKYVCCWRKEELSKVVVHELIHFFMLDYLSTAHLNIGIIDGFDCINEAYTETLATIIRCIMITQATNVELSDILAEEITFSLFQTAKIIVLSGGAYWSDFVDNKIVLKQNTSVRSYYIIKTMLLCNITTFVCWLNENLKLPSENKYIKFLHDIFAMFNKNTFIINAINTFCNILLCITQAEQKRFPVITFRMTAH